VPAVARRAYAHEAVLVLHDGADAGAPGAAITAALCGHWVHDPPCPLAPHHTAAEEDGEHLRLRVLFAVEPPREAEVRRRIDAALARGRLDDAPDGVVARWALRSSGPDRVRSGEAAHARHLAG
jgi:hypothetical protein